MARKPRNLSFVWITPLILIFLNGCVSGTFGNHQDVEMYPLRSANESESKRLKHCLQNAYSVMEEHKTKTGKYYRRVIDMPLDSFCNGFMLGHLRTQDGYEIMAQFHEKETTVRWTVNQDGVIEEHIDPTYEMDENLW